MLFVGLILSWGVMDSVRVSERMGRKPLVKGFGV